MDRIIRLLCENNKSTTNSEIVKVDSNTKDISNVAHGPENAIYVHTLVGDMSGNSYQVVVYNNREYSSWKGK